MGGILYPKNGAAQAIGREGSNWKQGAFMTTMHVVANRLCVFCPIFSKIHRTAMKPSEKLLRKPRVYFCLPRQTPQQFSQWRLFGSYSGPPSSFLLFIQPSVSNTALHFYLTFSLQTPCKEWPQGLPSVLPLPQSPQSLTPPSLDRHRWLLLSIYINSMKRGCTPTAGA